MGDVRTAGDALLREIIAHPGDDGLRLIYADYCEDAGQPERARLIRLQIRPPGRTPRLSVRKWFSPWWRGRSSYSFHNPQYDLIVYPRHADELADARPGCLYVRRGFVEEVRLPLQAWLDHGPALVRAHPLRRVTLTDRVPYHNAAGCWLWETTNAVDTLGHPIPKGIYRLLKGFKYDPVVRWCRAYDTEQAARDALSAAALAWAWLPDGERG